MTPTPKGAKNDTKLDDLPRSLFAQHMVILRDQKGIKMISCAFCLYLDIPFGVWRADFSHVVPGLPRYNAMRAAMVKHLLAKHFLELKSKKGVSNV